MQTDNQAATLTIAASSRSLALRTEAQPVNIPTQFAIAMMKYQQEYHFMVAATSNFESMSLSSTNEAPSPSARQLGHPRLKLKTYRKLHQMKKFRRASPSAENVTEDIAMEDGLEEEIGAAKLTIAKDPVAASALAARRQERVVHRAHLKLALNARKVDAVTPNNNVPPSFSQHPLSDQSLSSYLNTLPSVDDRFDLIIAVLEEISKNFKKSQQLKATTKAVEEILERQHGAEFDAEFDAAVERMTDAQLGAEFDAEFDAAVEKMTDAQLGAEFDAHFGAAERAAAQKTRKAKEFQ